MSYGYRRRSYGGRSSYGGGSRRRSSGARVRRTLKASMATNTSTIATQAIAIPVDSTRNVGINIHEFRVEYVAIDSALAAAEYYSTWLNRIQTSHRAIERYKNIR